MLKYKIQTHKNSQAKIFLRCVRGLTLLPLLIILHLILQKMKVFK